ncbi:MAG: glutathione S-transferase family protein [Phenylobacterium sp.]|uniref:glutathione S-transferase family protein n=1 Tax=Phenylobacterium sp. TaxID=1871053 RepID=UPI002735136E|nr:glutathione S-transferase family protein [Phenylobacterium sp.]MDP3749426.1 glutathione S-transferase family protein [Phenylobacterium sp.]
MSNTPVLKLHTVAGSPNGRKVEAVIAHLGLKVEILHHDFRELASPAFKAINPNGMVPVLAVEGYRLTESNAIMQYLAEKAGDERLYPRDARGRAEVARWQAWELVHFNRAFGALAFEAVAKPSLKLGPADPVAVAEAQVGLARFAPVLEAHMKDRAFLLGDNLTIADYSVATFESYRTITPFDWSPFAAVNAYLDRVHATEVWQRVSTKAEPVAV